MDESGVTANIELGRRLALLRGVTPDDGEKWQRTVDNRRRYVVKLLGGKVPRPTRQTCETLERALGLRAGYFVIPPRRRQQDRLEQAEAEIATLRRAIERLRRGQRAMVLRLDVLEVAAGIQAPQEDQPPKAPKAPNKGVAQ